jgi:hypothetical protein
VVQVLLVYLDLEEDWLLVLLVEESGVKVV